MSSGPTYLVTGGAGFIGSNIVAYLVERGERVRVIDNLITGHRRNLEPLLDRIDFIEGDLREPAECVRAVSGVDLVLHQAAVPSVPRSVADPLLAHESGLTATLNLLIAACEAGVGRFVYASSSSVYGDQPGDAKAENLPPHPRSPYAASKAAAEHYLEAFYHCYGMETVGLRYFNVFGPRQDPASDYAAVVPRFITAALEGSRPTIFGDGRQSRDFTFVENNVQANILAATGDFDAAGQVYNIAGGETFSVLDLLDEINSILGTNVAPVHAEARVGDIFCSRADISRARADLAYEVTVPFREGLQRTIAWYQRLRGAPLVRT